MNTMHPTVGHLPTAAMLTIRVHPLINTAKSTETPLPGCVPQNMMHRGVIINTSAVTVGTIAEHRMMIVFLKTVGFPKKTIATTLTARNVA
jgi:hypothetical protein